jgi:hypothetical protein
MRQVVRCDNEDAVTDDSLRMRDDAIDFDEGHVGGCPLLLIYFSLVRFH